MDFVYLGNMAHAKHIDETLIEMHNFKCWVQIKWHVECNGLVSKKSL